MKKTAIFMTAAVIFFSALRIGTSEAQSQTGDVLFSTQEREWIKNHPQVKLGVLKDAPPYEYLDNGVYKGLSSGYVKIIAEKTGINFDIVAISDWHEIPEMLSIGTVEVLSLAVRDFNYGNPLILTRPYLSSSLGIFGNTNTAFINNFDDVWEQKVAIGEDTLVSRPVFKDNKKFVRYDNMIEAMQAVEDGKVDLYVGDILHSKFATDKFDLKKLRYIAPVVGSAYSFSFAVIPEDKILAGIINKVLEEITPAEHFQIRREWTSVDFGNEEVVRQRYLNYLYLSFAIFSMILLGILYFSHNHRKKTLQLAHMQKMESIGQLAGGVAHDFNNMLAGIRGAAEMLTLKANGKELKKYTDIIINACERSSYLTSQLLVFARDKEQKSAEMNLHSCLKDGLALLEHGVDKKIVVKSRLEAENCCIYGNCNLLQSMLLNLGFNARDAMNGKGEIMVKTRNVVLTPDDIADCLLNVKSQEYIEIAVKDNGCGISKQILPKIFEPFFTTKKIGNGTGLGLAAVYGIVEKHKGTIKVESSDRGTVFYIYLPVSANKECPRHTVPKAEKISAKILVVDDEKILLELMKDILSALGAEVITVSDSLKALEVYKQNPDIDVVMLDVIMPGLGGVEILEKLRDINPQVKVIFMSGYDKDNIVAEKVKKDENLAFINKPYTMVDCQQKISKMLAK